MIIKKQFYGIFLKNLYQLKNEKKFFVLFLFFPIMITLCLKIAFKFNVDYLLYFLLFIILIQNVELQRKLLISLVNERYIGFKIHNKIIGLTEFSYISSELCFHYLKGIFSVFITNIFLIFLQSHDLGLQNIFNYFYLMVFCSINFILFISLFLRSPQIAGDLSQILFLLLNILCLFYGISKTEASFILSFLPQFNFFILIKEKLMIFSNKDSDVNKKNLYFFTFLWGIIYLFLFFYLEKVVPDKFGVKKNLFYFLDFFKKKQIKSNIEENIENELFSVYRSQNKKGLIIKGISKKYENFYALNNINCEFDKGNITCIWGHNGAGKSTLINIICGIIKRNKGNIFLDEINLSEDKNYIKNILGYCPADDILFDELTVQEHLIMKYYIKNLIYTYGNIKTMMSQLDLLKYKDYKVKELSGGNKRKLSIALSLIGNVRILFLDEPSSNLDPFSRREIWKIIKKIKDTDCIIILATHHMDEVEFLSDKIILLENGNIKANGTLNEFKRIFGEGNIFNIESENNLNSLNENLKNLKINLKENNKKFNNDDLKIQYINDNNIKLKINNNSLAYFDILYNINNYITKDEWIKLKTKTIEKIYLKLGKHVESQNDITIQKLYDNTRINYNNKINNNFFKSFIQMIKRRILFLFFNINQLIIFLLHNFCIFLIIYGVIFIKRGSILHEMFGKVSSKVLTILLFTDFISCFTNSSIVYFIVFEKKYNIQHFLFLNRISFFIYYFATIVADIIMQIIPLFFISLYFSYYIHFKNFTEILNIKEFWVLISLLLFSKINFIFFNYLVTSNIFSNPNNSIKYNGILWYFTLILSSILIIPELNFYDLNLLFSSLINPYIINLSIFSKGMQNTEIKLIKTNDVEMGELIKLFWKNSFMYQFIAFLLIIFIIKFIRYSKIILFENKPESNFLTNNIDHNSIEKEKRKIEKNNNSKLKLINLGKKYKQGNPSACYNINLLIKEKQTLSLLGHNGAGKSTVINMIINLVKKGSGDIILLNKNQDKKDSFLENRIGVCIQIDSLWSDFTVKEHFNIYSKIWGTNEQYNDVLIEFLNLAPHINKRISELSSGNKRKLNFALSLLGNPELLILDEATCGVDVEMRYRIKTFLNYLKNKFNLSILLTTHIMSEAEILSDKIALMKKGEMVFINSIKELKQKEKGYHINLNFERENMDSNSISVKFNEFLKDKGNIIEFQELSNIEIKIIVNQIKNPIEFILFLDDLKNKKYFIDYNLRNLSLEDIFILKA